MTNLFLSLTLLFTALLSNFHTLWEDACPGRARVYTSEVHGDHLTLFSKKFRTRRNYGAPSPADEEMLCLKQGM